LDADLVRALVINVFRLLTRMTLLAADESGMSTVEYSNVVNYNRGVTWETTNWAYHVPAEGRHVLGVIGRKQWL
jgi:hypothetical protein